MQQEKKNGDETFPLDEAAITMVGELRINIANSQAALNAILLYFARQHQINGPIQLAENGRELILKPVRQAEPPKQTEVQ